MAFEGYTEREIAVRLKYRADQLIRMIDVNCPQVILDEQRAMVREAAMVLPAGRRLGGDPCASQ